MLIAPVALKVIAPPLPVALLVLMVPVEMPPAVAVKDTTLPLRAAVVDKEAADTDVLVPNVQVGVCTVKVDVDPEPVRATELFITREPFCAERVSGPVKFKLPFKVKLEAVAVKVIPPAALNDPAPEAVSPLPDELAIESVDDPP